MQSKPGFAHASAAIRKIDQYIESYFMSAKAELLKEPIESAALANYIGRCANNYCVDTVDFMRKNQLSIFKAIDVDNK